MPEAFYQFICEGWAVMELCNCGMGSAMGRNCLLHSHVFDEPKARSAEIMSQEYVNWLLYSNAVVLLKTERLINNQRKGERWFFRNRTPDKRVSEGRIKK